MNMHLANAAEVAKQAVQSAAGHTGETFLAVIVVLGVLAIVAAYIWFIAVPERKTRERLTETLVEATAALGRVTSETHELVKEGNRLAATHQSQSATILREIEQLRTCVLDAAEACEAVARAVNADISKPIGRILGRLEQA